MIEEAQREPCSPRSEQIGYALDKRFRKTTGTSFIVVLNAKSPELALDELKIDTVIYL